MRWNVCNCVALNLCKFVSWSVYFQRLCVGSNINICKLEVYELKFVLWKFVSWKFMT